MVAIESTNTDARSGNDQSSPDGNIRVSRQSYIGLNAVNFFLAEVVGVVMPFFGKYLKEHEWGETAIGFAIAVAGLGVFLAQTPAGLIVDRVRHRRREFGAVATGSRERPLD